MCLSVNDQGKAAPYQQYYQQNAPGSKLAKYPGIATMLGRVMMKRDGKLPGQTGDAAAQARKTPGGI